MEMELQPEEEETSKLQAARAFHCVTRPSPVSVAFHSFSDCNISLPLRFVCCILLSNVAEVCLN